jgi:two-component system sensor histidine kinase BaeS
MRTGMWDYGRINQLVINLIDNSISYTDAPGEVCITVIALDNCLRMEVEDSAPGLTPHDVAHLFEPLYRADAARSRRTGGSGLGLKISKVIADAHHALVDVQPSRLGGVRVRVDLPYERDSEREVA